MEFARKVWKVLVAVKDGLALVLLLLFFGVLYAALSARPGAAAVHEGALLISLDGFVVEEPAIPDPLTMLVSQQAPMGEHRARDVVRALRTAAEDDRITSVALDLTGFMGGGMVHLQDIGDAIDAVRAKGKKVLAFGLFYMDDAMLLAAHADEVWVDPGGGAFITGPGGSRLYFAGLLEKTKIKVNVFRVGTFKSAVEPYLLTGPSDASRQADEALYGALWEEWQADFRKARPKVDLARITDDAAGWLAASGGDPAQAAKAAGLVDRIGNRTDFNLRMQEIAGEDPIGGSFGAFAQTGMAAWLAANPEEQPGEPIGVVTIAGEIVDGEAGPGIAGADRIVDVIEQAYDEDLAALVVRVDSPGGSILGSEHIRRALLRFKDKKVPIVVSMANLGASGGYWVSTPAQRIFAEPGTITGSIGVFAVVPTFGEALGEIGVTAESVGTTPLSGQPDPFKGFSPQVSAIMQGTVENNYRKFISLVAGSRGISAASAASWAEGRPWPGGAARQLGLVDQFGGLEDALAHAAKLAKLGEGEWHAMYLGEQAAGPLAGVLGRLAGARATSRPIAHADLFAAVAARQDAAIAQVRATLERLTSERGMQAICLECPAAGPQPAATAAHGGPVADRLLPLLRLIAG
jgi:protease-4